MFNEGVRIGQKNEHDVPRYPWNEPNFFKLVGITMVVIHTRFEWFLTPYASCDMSTHLSAFFDRENSGKGKFAENQNNLACCPELVIQGHEKNWGHFKDVGNNVLSPEHPPLIMVYVWTPFKSPQLLQACGHAHGRHPCQVRMNSDIVCILRRVGPFIGIFSSAKLQKGEKRNKKQKPTKW